MKYIAFKTNLGFDYIEKTYNISSKTTVVIASAIKDIMTEYFAIQMNYFLLINNPSGVGPYTGKKYDKIVITCKSEYWSQISFQLAHEYCHMLIGKPVAQNLRWLEETIAEVSSLFFLSKFSEYWKTNNFLNNPDYSNSLNDYVSNRINMANIDITQKVIYQFNKYRTQRISLRKYDRDTNLAFAVLFLPIFQTFPELWIAVPRLADIPKKLPLFDSFKYWISISPSYCTVGLKKISDIFFNPNSPS